MKFNTKDWENTLEAWNIATAAAQKSIVDELSAVKDIDIWLTGGIVNGKTNEESVHYNYIMDLHEGYKERGKKRITPVIQHQMCSAKSMMRWVASDIVDDLIINSYEKNHKDHDAIR